jgi:malate permease and related proteins
LRVLSALLDVVLPVLLVVAVGAALGRFIKPDAQSISKITLYALTPALALYNLAHSEAKLESAARIIAGYLLFQLIMGRLTWLASLDQPDDTRRAMVASVITGNNGNFGLPISFFALGQVGLELSLVVFTISVFTTFTVTPSVLRAGDWRSSFSTVARLPLIWAALLGVTLNLLDIRIPAGLDRGIQLLGQAAVPLLLISLGLQLGSNGLPKPTLAMTRATGLRLLLGPAVALFITVLFAMPPLEQGVIVLSSAMPTAVNAFLIAQELRADAKLVSGVVVLTTLLSIPVIALVVMVLRSGA